MFLALGALLGACGGGGPDEVRVDSIEPSSAAFGDEIVIHGSGFTAKNNEVAFGLSGRVPAATSDSSYIASTMPLESPDGETLRFVLEDNLGACLGPWPPERDLACAGVGVELPLGDTHLAVSNRNGVSNAVPFTHTETVANIAKADAEAKVLASPEYKQLTADLDRWIDDYYCHPADPSAVAGYGFTVAQAEDGHLFIQFGLSFIDPAATNIPDEIAGYPVEVSAGSGTWIPRECP